MSNKHFNLNIEGLVTEVCIRTHAQQVKELTADNTSPELEYLGAYASINCKSVVNPDLLVAADGFITTYRSIGEGSNGNPRAIMGIAIKTSLEGSYAVLNNQYVEVVGKTTAATEGLPVGSLMLVCLNALDLWAEAIAESAGTY